MRRGDIIIIKYEGGKAGGRRSEVAIGEEILRELVVDNG